MILFDFDNPGRSHIRFDNPLNFPDEDRKRYPWLNAASDRFYIAERALDRGGFSIPYVGYACTQDGIRIPGSDDVVIKFPNLSEDRESRQIKDRLQYISEQTITEWELVRKKLIGYRGANPIFDFGTVWTQGHRQLFVTVQPYIRDAEPLKKWLLRERLRPIFVHEPSGEEVDNWRGLNRRDDWVRICTFIGEGLAEIHRRRVIHGDVWPPNIYVRNGYPEEAIFIDFGESFVTTPAGEHHIQPDHAYRAPERGKPEYVPTEQIDIYSFGKLMLYLAVGKDFKIPKGDKSNVPLSGHRRRHFVRDLLFDRNRPLILPNPGILDLIAKCTTLEPVDRPTMVDVLDHLKRMSRPKASTDFIARLERIVETSRSCAGGYRQVFTRLIDRRVQEAERLIESCGTDMIALRGTRDELISDLVVLFSELEGGDSWTTLTTPSMWQHSALGLDGRYSTATFEAVLRGASIQRAYMITVEELGAEWSELFARKLEETGIPELIDLSERFRIALADLKHAEATAKDFRPRSPEFELEHRRRFICVLEALHSMVGLWDLQGRIFSGKFTNIREVSGLFLGLLPVSDGAEVRKLRALNPVSLMYVSAAVDPEDRWLLVMTDIRGRTENDAGTASQPQLLGVKVFKSKLVYPKDRVMGLEKALSQNSTNIGQATEVVLECAKSTEIEVIGLS